jgi:hypothetical protein
MHIHSFPHATRTHTLCHAIFQLIMHFALAGLAAVFSYMATITVTLFAMGLASVFP